MDIKTFKEVVADLLGDASFTDYSIADLRTIGIDTDRFGVEVERMNRDAAGPFVFEKRKQNSTDQEMFTIRITKRPRCLNGV